MEKTTLRVKNEHLWNLITLQYDIDMSDETKIDGVQPFMHVLSREVSTVSGFEAEALAKQYCQIEVLRDQEQLTEQQVVPERLLNQLQALHQIGTYDYRALGQAKMLLQSDGSEQLDHRHFYDHVLIGKATEVESAQYLMDHFQYVCKWSINWKWPELQRLWEEKKQILKNMRTEIQASHEQWRQERVDLNETAPELVTTNTKSEQLRQERNNSIYVQHAAETRVAIKTMIDEIIANPQEDNRSHTY